MVLESNEYYLLGFRNSEFSLLVCQPRLKNRKNNSRNINFFTAESECNGIDWNSNMKCRLPVPNRYGLRQSNILFIYQTVIQFFQMLAGVAVLVTWICTQWPRGQSARSPLHLDSCANSILASSWVRHILKNESNSIKNWTRYIKETSTGMLTRLCSVYVEA